MLEFERVGELQVYLKGRKRIKKIAVQSLDLTTLDDILLSMSFKGCLFLGCKMSPDVTTHLLDGNYIFPELDVPFNVYPNSLYSRHTLYNGYDRTNQDTYNITTDKVIYDYYVEVGKESMDVKETLARALHDHSITDAMQEFLADYDEKKIVAIMGGHSMSRASESYRKVVSIAKKLTEMGFLLISGGGPGAMEATHVGVWFAGKSEKEIDEAITILSRAPKYNHPNWLSTAFEVIEKYPEGNYKSLGIPTWLYGHEPPTPFASHIAKYFANSVREEGLLAVAKGGVVFSPGSAGTMQEIFQDLAQNHYESFGFASPMVFLDKDYWMNSRPVYPVLESMRDNGVLSNLMLGLYDDVDDIVKFIEGFGKVV